MERIELIKNELAYGITETVNDINASFLENFIVSYKGSDLYGDLYSRFEIVPNYIILGEGEVLDYLYIIAETLGYTDLLITYPTEHVYECSDELINILKGLYHYCSAHNGDNYYFIKYSFTDFYKNNVLSGIKTRARRFLIDNILKDL